MTEIKQVAIVGGGTAGWLSAAILARKLHSQNADHIQISLIESPDVSTVGVGEGTFPTMVETLKYIGIDEHLFMRKCTATFKQAIKFCNWEYDPETKGENSYFHLFDAPFRITNFDLCDAWLRGLYPQKSYAESVAGQGYICNAGLGPKRPGTEAFNGLTKYAYHLDAGKFAELLTEHCVNNLGVTHIKAHVESAVLDDDGFIESVITREHGKISADFFIDCSGFSALLLGQHLQVPFIDKSHVLFVDHAITIQVPYSEKNEPIACHTISTAHAAGWTWDIGLSERRGIGYVYSHAHTSHEDAEQVLRKYIGNVADKIDSRKLSMRVGYRKKMWEKNCVAIGLAGGFMEPLEATAIAMIETAGLMLAGQFPRTRGAIPAIAEKLNHAFAFRWEKIVDFIKLHYLLSKRNDNAFWQDNRKNSSVPETLQEKLELWKNFRPVENDFPNRLEMFSLASYEYILYGMNFKTVVVPDPFPERTTDLAPQAFGLLDEKIRQALSELPKHRQLITEIYQRNQ